MGKCLTCQHEVQDNMFCDNCWTITNPQNQENNQEEISHFSSDNWTNDSLDIKQGEREILASPKIKEITEYETWFYGGETLEEHKEVHVHVRTEQGIMDVWVSNKVVREKGNNLRIKQHIKNRVLEVMWRNRKLILKYYNKK